MRLSHQEIDEALGRALSLDLPEGVGRWTETVYPQTVVYRESVNGASVMYERPYVIDAQGVAVLGGEPLEVRREVSHVPVRPATFSLDGPVTWQGDVAFREGKIFELGTYPGTSLSAPFSLTEREADEIVIGKFTPVPCDLDHLTEKGHKTVLDEDGKLGRLVSVRREGSALYGRIEMPRPLAELIGKGALPISAAFDPGTKRMTSVAYTLFPRITDAQVVAAFTAAPRKGTPMEFIKRFLSGLSPEERAEARNLVGQDPATFADPESGRLREENARLAAQLETGRATQVTAAAGKFSEEYDAKLTPAEKPGVAALFTVCLKADAAGRALFTDAGAPAEGDAVAALRGLLAARPDHDLTKEGTGVRAVVAFAAGTGEKAFDSAAIYAARDKAFREAR